MSHLSQITHSDKFVQDKVNFFADYFHYAVHQMGLNDNIEIENHLSLIEKSIFQIETNIDESVKYLNKYFSHSLLEVSNKYFKKYKSYNTLSAYLTTYSHYAKDGHKLSWIKSTPLFLNELKSFRHELRRKMLQEAIKSIISFLQCEHDINHHLADLIHYTNVIVSAFLFSGRTKKELNTVFEKILSKDIKDYPFPKYIKKKKNNINFDDAKINFINNRSFKQQFEGILDIFQESPNAHNFIFRIMELSAEKNFSFKYNQVTFYNPKHRKFDKLSKIFKSENFKPFIEFIQGEVLLLALVKVRCHNAEIAQNEALLLIEKELKFLNLALKSDPIIDKSQCLAITNFSKMRWRLFFRSPGDFIKDSKKSDINNTPFKFLRHSNISTECANHFLAFESIFVEALTTNNPQDFWQYLENLIPLKDNKKRVISVFSDLLIISAEKENNIIIDNYIFNVFIGSPYKLLGITSEQYKYYFESFKRNYVLDVINLKNDIKHPFINYLLDYRLKKEQKMN